ncbi:hypothetical protein SAMN05421504_101300 [Amycolatopsis xylanica]|uniref:Uncharacterized protein n=1 Tax=Amycolatopsis xylanica TaxID=589385 RepID=A0A1H2SPX7_9PSEU|nr:hypothetical protein [Amycolatopsis xylanica]SDW33650.1 hypothetical protein SAMN05421504_101300 [Amycolatopsis xylanica]
MKILCSFSLLLRFAFWLSLCALTTGVVLGTTHGTAPAKPADAVVPAHRKEVR